MWLRMTHYDKTESPITMMSNYRRQISIQSLTENYDNESGYDMTTIWFMSSNIKKRGNGAIRNTCRESDTLKKRFNYI